MLAAISPGVMLLGQPAWGVLSDWWQDRRAVLLVLLGGVGATALLFPFARSFPALVVAMAAMALFQGPVMPVADSIALDEAARYGGDYAGRRLFGSLGFALAAAAAGWVFARADLRLLFPWYAVCVVAAAVVTLRTRPMPYETGRWRSPWSGLAELRRARGFGLFLAVLFAAQVAMQAHNSFFTLYLDDMAAGESGVGLIWMMSAAVEVAAYPLAGRFIRRVGARRATGLGLLLWAARFALYVAARTPAHALAVQIVAGFGYSLFQAAAVGAARELLPDELKVTGQSMMAFAGGGLAAIAGNLAGGWLVDQAGAVTMYAWAAGATAAAAAAYFALLPRMARTAVRAKLPPV